MIGMPVTGFIESAYDGYPIKRFDLIQTSEIFAKNDRVDDLFARLHGLGQWSIYALIILHLSGVVFHLIFTKSGVPSGILPAHALDPNGE